MARIILGFFLATFLSFTLMASLEPAESGFSVEGVDLSVGSAVIHLEKGTATPVTEKDGAAGFLFSGTGTFTMKVSDPFALQVLPYNLEHGSHLPARESPVTEPFTEILCLGNPAMDLIPDTLDTPSPAGEMIKGMAESYFDQPVFQIVPFARAGITNGTAELGCYLKGRHDTLIYMHDPVWRQLEILSALDTSTFRRKGKSNLLIQYDLVSQPLGWKRPEARPSTLLMTGMLYDMDFRNMSNLQGTYTVGYTASRPGLKAVQLDLLNRVFTIQGQGLDGRSLFHEEDVDYETTSYTVLEKTLSVVGVSLLNGKSLAYSHSGDILTVHLPAITRAGDTVQLKIEVKGNVFEPTPEEGSYVALSGVSWFPAPCDGYQSVDAVFSGTIRTKKPILAFASADVFEQKEVGDEAIFTGKTSFRDDYHALAIGTYFPKTSTIRDVDITISSAVFENQKAQELLSGLTDAILDIYTHYLDAFPFKHLFLIEGKGLGYGHAPPAMVFASGEIFNSLKDEETQLYSKGANERFAHEVAHQYFGHMVRDRQPGDEWLTEAASEYMAALFLKFRWHKKDFKYLYTFWYNRVKTRTGVASPYAAHLLDGLDADTYRWDLIYCKGPVILHALRDEVGDKMFYTILRSFLKSFPHQKASTEDFIGLVNYITKKEWHPFFEKYVYGMELPPKSSSNM
ncbi:MAG TPA: M1 family aminopeptidase [Thermoanaerobaculia bacterium]|nr:M1 family aminopeptidase [Thermoanaerobaculia bacterium]HUM30775.1 M1 family aminopeptidase [Thermoanaerobaculia bacterium]HXK69025.1 M1 family aminopeptidase [Thermoanaerobaculia bacterium]